MPLTASREYVESEVDALKLLEMELIVFFEDGTEVHRAAPEPKRDPYFRLVLPFSRTVAESR